MSRTSVARWRISSSSTAANMSAYMVQMLSTAASAQAPPSMASCIWESMKGSASMDTWPVRISDSFWPTRSRISAAMAEVRWLNRSMPSWRRAFSESLPEYVTAE